MDKQEFEAWEDRVAARARVLWAEAGGLEGGPEGGPETRAGDAGRRRGPDWPDTKTEP